MQQGESVPIKATRTMIRIIEALDERGTAGVSELASELEMPKSTVHDHLTSLNRNGYVVKEDQRYGLSTRFLELGGHHRSRTQLFTIARPELDKLAADTDEHVNLMIEEEGSGIFMYIAKGADAVQVDSVHYTGMHVPLHATSLGKAIMANMTDERLEELLDRHGLPEVTEWTVTDRETLFEELDRIRDQGYAVDDEERVEGMRCIGCPIVTQPNGVVGAISVSAPVNRMQGERFETEIPRLVRQTANVIEVQLNYS